MSAHSVPPQSPAENFAPKKAGAVGCVCLPRLDCANRRFCPASTFISLSSFTTLTLPQIFTHPSNLHSRLSRTVTTIPQRWLKAMLTSRRRASWGKLPWLKFPIPAHMSKMLESLQQRRSCTGLLLAMPKLEFQPCSTFQLMRLS